MYNDTDVLQNELSGSSVNSLFYLSYALVIARFRVQYDQYFTSFSYFAEITAKCEERGKYWPYCAR